MAKKMYICIAIILVATFLVFPQSSVASNLQLERINKPANGIVEVLKFNGYINGEENLYFEFKNAQGHKGRGYITRLAEVINSYVLNEQTGELIDVERSEFTGTSEQYITINQDCRNQVNKKFTDLDGKKGSLVASLDTDGNLSFEFTNNNGQHITEFINNAAGIR